jgi:hypothetical protein
VARIDRAEDVRTGHPDFGSKLLDLNDLVCVSPEGSTTGAAEAEGKYSKTARREAGRQEAVVLQTLGIRHSPGLKLYVPSTVQLGADSVGHDTSALPWNQVNFPVPPENVHSPRPVAKSSLQ